MSHEMVLVIYGFLLAIQSVAYAMQNVTVEDSDPSIQYSGVWSRDESVTSTEDPLATATLKFTGVAFYFISPLEDEQPAHLTIDGVPYNVDLSDYDDFIRGGLDSSSVIWGTSGLVNIEHNVVFSIPTDSNLYLDAILYTVLGEGDDPVVSPTPIPTTASSTDLSDSTTTSSSTSSVVPSPVSRKDSSSRNSHSIMSRTSVIAGVIAGGILFLCGAIYLCSKTCRKRPDVTPELEASGSKMLEISSHHEALDSYASRRYVSPLSENQQSRLISLRPSSRQYIEVRNMLLSSWKHPKKAKPFIQAIFEIVSSKESRRSYLNYRESVQASLSEPTASEGNQRYLFHGTNRACPVGDEANNIELCFSEACFICGVIRNSFDLAKCGIKNNFRRFGAGIYTTSCSSKAHDYALNLIDDVKCDVLLLNRVVVGNALTKRKNDQNRTGVPSPYHSLFGEPGEDLNYDETVVYHSSAIQPAYLIAFTTKQRATLRR